MTPRLAPPWLVFDLPAPHRVLSWSLNRPGFVTASRFAWREVRNADLPRDLDAAAWFRAELAGAGHSEAVGFLTSRALTHHVTARARVEEAAATCVATVGLSNAERVGARRAVTVPVGTINIAVALTVPLSDAALLEALSIAAEARTAAVIAHGPDLATGRATGTGTDCIAVAAPSGDMSAGATAHAGLHTAVGEALGRAVLDAVTRGTQDWMDEQGERHG
ncbi:MAG: adenosylcobinamide amidohydrolase [Pseudomonadota bacterium]